MLDYKNAEASEAEEISKMLFVPDILIPEVGVLADEFIHHGVALLQIQVHDFDPLAQQERFRAGERPGFPNDDFPDTKLRHGPGAQITGHKRRIQDGAPITAHAPGILQTINLSVKDRVILLHPLIVSSAQDLLPSDKNRADRNTALREALTRLFQSGPHKGVHNRLLTCLRLAAVFHKFLDVLNVF